MKMPFQFLGKLSPIESERGFFDLRTKRGVCKNKIRKNKRPLIPIQRAVAQFGIRPHFERIPNPSAHNLSMKQGAYDKKKG